MTYINENWEITTKGEPDPVVNLECYRLVLYHELSDGERLIELEPPIIKTYVISTFEKPDLVTTLTLFIERFRQDITTKLGG